MWSAETYDSHFQVYIFDLNKCYFVHNHGPQKVNVIEMKQNLLHAKLLQTVALLINRTIKCTNKKHNFILVISMQSDLVSYFNLITGYNVIPY